MWVSSIPTVIGFLMEGAKLLWLDLLGGPELGYLFVGGLGLLLYHLPQGCRLFTARREEQCGREFVPGGVCSPVISSPHNASSFRS
jgi:hypothetical protein